MLYEAIYSQLVQGVVQETLSQIPIFEDRYLAGKKLGEILKELITPNSVIIAIANGGIPITMEALGEGGNAIFVLPASKVSLGVDSRFGIGTLTPWNLLINPDVYDLLRPTKDELILLSNDARSSLAIKQSYYRDFIPGAEDISGKDVILIDDGISSGSTIIASAKYIKPLGPNSIKVASPVASSRALENLERLGIGGFVLESSESPCFLVDRFYQKFEDLDPIQQVNVLRERNSI